MRWLAVLLAGCAPPAATASPVPPPAPEPERTIFAIDELSIGPITKNTPATLTALRETVGRYGYAVRATQSGGLDFRVYDGDEMLFYVVPNDDGSLFNVHVVSGRVPIVQHPAWVIGKAFVEDEVLTCCECWGENPVCFRQGDHVAIGFTRACDDLFDEDGRRALEKTPIQRAVWSPNRFDECDSDEGSGPQVPAWIPRAN